jgi:branched-chain amino acid transport system ATP-binding protein
MSGLALRGVTVTRESSKIVRDVDLDVPAGEVTVLLGPNGAGKTTLLEAISGLLRATVARASASATSSRVERSSVS